MKTLLGGAIATVFGILFMAVWWKELFLLLAGCIPIMLILGGVLAIYLGSDELKEAGHPED